MTRDEWNQVLATEPATGTQVGAIIGDFERLGVVDRAERLAITAELLGLENLGSTTALVMGDAGRLIAMLRRTRDRGELPGVTTADGPGEDGDRMSVAEAIKCMIVIVAAVLDRRWLGAMAAPGAQRTEDNGEEVPPDRARANAGGRAAGGMGPMA